MGVGGDLLKFLAGEFQIGEVPHSKGGTNRFFEHVFFDMNQILHRLCWKVEKKLKNNPSHSFTSDLVLPQLFKKITLICRFFATPTKNLMLVFDGIGPRAKYSEQRRRRRKQTVSNFLTPGTTLMKDLHNHLVWWCGNAIQSSLFKTPVNIFFSGPFTHGEGEFKIFNQIRRMREVHDRFLVVGSDSDCILNALLVPNKVFLLNIDNISKGQLPKILECEHIKLSLMNHARQLCSPSRLNCSRLMDDFLVLALFMGNDFLPASRGYNLRQTWYRYLNLIAHHQHPFLYDSQNYLLNGDLFSRLFSDHMPPPSQSQSQSLSRQEKHNAHLPHYLLEYFEGLVWNHHYYHGTCWNYKFTPATTIFPSFRVVASLQGTEPVKCKYPYDAILSNGRTVSLKQSPNDYPLDFLFTIQTHVDTIPPLFREAFILSHREEAVLPLSKTWLQEQMNANKLNIDSVVDHLTEEQFKENEYLLQHTHPVLRFSPVHSWGNEFASYPLNFSDFRLSFPYTLPPTYWKRDKLNVYLFYNEARSNKFIGVKKELKLTNREFFSPTQKTN